MDQIGRGDRQGKFRVSLMNSDRVSWDKFDEIVALLFVLCLAMGTIVTFVQLVSFLCSMKQEVLYKLCITLHHAEIHTEQRSPSIWSVYTDCGF